MSECPETGFAPCYLISEVDGLRARAEAAEAEVKRLRERVRDLSDMGGQAISMVASLLKDYHGTDTVRIWLEQQRGALAAAEALGLEEKGGD